MVLGAERPVHCKKVLRNGLRDFNLSELDLTRSYDSSIPKIRFMPNILLLPNHSLEYSKLK